MEKRLRLRVALPTVTFAGLVNDEADVKKSASSQLSHRPHLPITSLLLFWFCSVNTVKNTVICFNSENTCRMNSITSSFLLYVNIKMHQNETGESEETECDVK